jgi:hypothetical protein
MTSPKAIKTIRGYYNDPASPEARQLFDWAAKQHGSKETTVSQMEEGAGLTRADVVTSMKELDRLRFGKFTVGRRSKESRMTWYVDLGALGQCAQGHEIDFDDPLEPAAPGNEAADIVHVFHLRPERRISLKLPSNLSAAEARRLADFILALPFPMATEAGASKTEE